MSGQLNDGMFGWIGRCVSERNKNVFKLSGTVHKFMLHGQSEELEWSRDRDLPQATHTIT
jgi:hypothetical protein